MAQNFLDKLLHFTGLTANETRGESVPTHFTDAEMAQQKMATKRSGQKLQEKTGKVTTVDSYLVQKNKRESIKETALITPNIAGIGKYHPTVASQKKGEEKSLIPLETIKKTENKVSTSSSPKMIMKTPSPEVVVTPIAKTVAKKPQPNIESKPVAEIEKIASSKKAHVSVAKKITKKETRVSNTTKKKTAEIPSDDAKIKTKVVVTARRWQAITGKKTRWRRKSNLVICQKKVDGQEQTFTVCNQHNNDKFRPFMGHAQSKGGA